MFWHDLTVLIWTVVNSVSAGLTQDHFTSSFEEEWRVQVSPVWDVRYCHPLQQTTLIDRIQGVGAISNTRARATFLIPILSPELCVAHAAVQTI